MFGWTDEQRIETLTYLLDNGLIQVVQSKKTMSFKEIEETLFKFIDDLLSTAACGISHNHIKKMIDKFNEFKFTNQEKHFWLNCFCSDEQIIKYYEQFKNSHSYEFTLGKDVKLIKRSAIIDYYQNILCKLINLTET